MAVLANRRVPRYVSRYVTAAVPAEALPAALDGLLRYATPRHATPAYKGEPCTGRRAHPASFAHLPCERLSGVQR